LVNGSFASVGGDCLGGEGKLMLHRMTKQAKSVISDVNNRTGSVPILWQLSLLVLDVLPRTTNRCLFHGRGCDLDKKPFDTHDHHLMLATLKMGGEDF
jgi:hypothetical protein